MNSSNATTTHEPAESRVCECVYSRLGSNFVISIVERTEAGLKYFFLPRFMKYLMFVGVSCKGLRTVRSIVRWIGREMVHDID